MILSGRILFFKLLRLLILYGRILFFKLFCLLILCGRILFFKLFCLLILYGRILYFKLLCLLILYGIILYFKLFCLSPWPLSVGLVVPLLTWLKDNSLLMLRSNVLFRRWSGPRGIIQLWSIIIIQIKVTVRTFSSSK